MKRASREIRLAAANAARRLLKNEINWSQFVDDFGDREADDDLWELFDLIEHEPKVGGWFGVSKEKYEVHKAETWRYIELLERE